MAVSVLVSWSGRQAVRQSASQSVSQSIRYSRSDRRGK